MSPRYFEPKTQSNRRQIDMVTYKLLFFLPDTSLCLFGDEIFRIFRKEDWPLAANTASWGILHSNSISKPPAVCHTTLSWLCFRTTSATQTSLLKWVFCSFRFCSKFISNNEYYCIESKFVLYHASLSNLCPFFLFSFLSFPSFSFYPSFSFLCLLLSFVIIIHAI